MKFLKIAGITLTSIVLLGLIAVKLMSQSEPRIIEGKDADLMANNMLKALNYEAWDSVNYVSFSFRGAHHYYWNKKDNNVVVVWGKNKVFLDLETLNAVCAVNDKLVKGKKKAKLKKKAWSYWCNDSFWFYAPYKVFDEGVKRSVVEIEDGTKGLMVSYESGGVTPGDKYMWILDENNMPTGWRMWVKIIPVKGVFTSWENYVELGGGAKLASVHKNGKLKLEISNIKSGDDYASIGMEMPLFELEKK